MKRVININILTLLMLLFVAAGCAVTDFDKSANFNEYRTFSWGKSEIKTENPIYNSDLINKNIKATVENEFAKRGITKSENADFVVSYHTYTEKKEETNGGYPYFSRYPFFPFGFYPYGFGWGFPYGYGYGGPRTSTYTEGTLIIDITDRKTDELIWRGAVSGNVDNVKSLQKQIQKGIKAIMKKYPVPAQDDLKLPDNDVVS